MRWEVAVACQLEYSIGRSEDSDEDPAGSATIAKVRPVRRIDPARKIERQWNHRSRNRHDGAAEHPGAIRDGARGLQSKLGIPEGSWRRFVIATERIAITSLLRQSP